MAKNTLEVSSSIYSVKNNTNGYIDNIIEPRIYIVSRWIGENKKILDVGCYNGVYAKVFLDNKNDVYGIDASSDAVAEASKHGIKAIVANLEERFPFDDETFDVVHAGEVIEHLYDTDIFVSECNRVLKRNGTFIVTTPNTLSLARRILYLFGNGKFFEASNTFSAEERSVGHIRFFTKKLLKNFIEANGFKMNKFTSDYVNLPLFRSNFLAKIVPTFGRILIMQFFKK
ncbi:MAG: class I SAM-dependent methyltransferase [Parcubacteria group bacterium]|jgi:2-polyprenyl-3-methyl-5-hydroxy-6-metoxy-1,4-benzoquinol methylase